MPVSGFFISIYQNSLYVYVLFKEDHLLYRRRIVRIIQVKTCVGIRLCGKYVILFHVIIYIFNISDALTLSVKLISLCACFLLLECDPNCAQCDTNGPAKCDDNHCNAGYKFVGYSKNCTGS